MTNKTNKIIELKNVSFGYKPEQQILKNISFSINENEFVCLVGLNGSGKSTLAKILMASLKPQKGTIEIFNKVLTNENVNEIKKSIGAVFENPDNQFIGYTVEDEIAFGLENLQIKREEMKSRVLQIAKQFDIVDLLNQSPMTLSGGQKQKVAIASCLVTNPKIIIFDESSSMLDPKDKLELRKLMIDLQNRYKKTIILITHDMDEASLANKIFLLEEGKLIKCEEPINFFNDIKVQTTIGEPKTFELAKKLELKPTTNLDKLVEEIIYEKK